MKRDRLGFDKDAAFRMGMKFPHLVLPLKTITPSYRGLQLGITEPIWRALMRSAHAYDIPGINISTLRRLGRPAHARRKAREKRR